MAVLATPLRRIPLEQQILIPKLKLLEDLLDADGDKLLGNGENEKAMWRRTKMDWAL